MKTARRRWWTTLVSVVAGLLVLTAVLSGAFQIAMLMVPASRERIASTVSDIAGRPVDIGGIELRWRGLSPQLELSDIRMPAPDASGDPLQAQRLSLSLSPRGLLRAGTPAVRLRLSGLSLSITVGEGGEVLLAGFPAKGANPTPDAVPSWRGMLARFDRCELNELAIDLQHPAWGSRPLRFWVREGHAQALDDGFELALDGELPARLGGALSVTARVQGPAERIADWSGRWQLTADRLRPMGWWPTTHPPRALLDAQALALSVEGFFEQGHLLRLHAQLDADALEARTGGQTVARSAPLQLQARWQRLGSPGWLAEIEGRAGEELLGPYIVEGSDDEHRLRTTRLPLDLFSPWSALLAPPDALGHWPALAGELRDVDLLLQHGVLAAGRARLVDLDLTLPDTLGIAHLSGDLAWTTEGGRWQPAPRAWTLDWPAVFEQPLPIERQSGAIEWRRLDEGWHLQADALELHSAGLTAAGHVRLDLPSGDAPVLDLDLRLDAAALAPWKAFMPRHWSDDLRGWLHHSLQGGRVEGGRLTLQGPLDEFPYAGADAHGRWQLALPIRALDLHFSPDWPPITSLDADLHFEGALLRLTAPQAQIAQLRLSSLKAQLPELAAGQLTVQGRAQGELTHAYELLRQSPLHARLTGLLDETQGHGPATVDLDLYLPLHDLSGTTVNGRVHLSDNRLTVDGLGSDIEHLTGEVAFSDDGVWSDGLHADWFGTTLRARIDPDPDSFGLLQVDARLAAEEGLGAHLLPAAWQPALGGQSDWRLSWPIGLADAPLHLRSDLVGLTIDAPPPLNKTSRETRPLRIDLQDDNGARLLRFQLEQPRLAGLVRLASDATGNWQLNGGTLHLGPNPQLPARVDTPGLHLSGRLPQLDLAEWIAYLPAQGGGDTLLHSLDLHLGALRWHDLWLEDQRLRYHHAESGWTLALSGAASGQLQRTGDTISGQLTRLALRYQTDGGVVVEDPAPPAPPRDPSTLPALSLNIDQLLINERPLGQFELRTRALENGLALDRLRTRNGLLDSELHGEWRRTPAGSEARLTLNVLNRDAEATLQALGYSPNLDAQETRLEGQLHWPPRPQGLDWRLAEGTLSLRAQDGMLRAVDPGAGRVLGLFNFYALPRRLLLDFRDVTDTGVRFDRIDGQFTLGHGLARTDNLSLTGPTLRMQVDGEVNLLARTLDQRVRVYPGMSGGVTLGATLLAGPAAGALMLLAQELLEKPLDQLTQLEYRVSGPWDAPDIRRPEGRTPQEVSPP